VSFSSRTAQIKLSDVCKAQNVSQYSLMVEKKISNKRCHCIVSVNRGDLKELGSTTTSKKSLKGSLTRLWRRQ
jgi:hypothetical protein